MYIYPLLCGFSGHREYLNIFGPYKTNNYFSFRVLKSILFDNILELNLDVNSKL